MNFANLNQPNISQDLGSEAYRRVLARLGDDIAAIVRLIQIRPSGAARVDTGGRYILVRLTTPGEHVVVRIDPDGDLAAELFFARELARRYIPTPRIIQADISRSQFPFPYLVETYVGGLRGDMLAEPDQLRGVARQLGRVCRRLHAIPAPGWGRPTLGRSWSAESWDAALSQLAGDGALETGARLVFGDELPQQFLEAMLSPDDTGAPPRLLHGDLKPAAIIVTPGEQAQLAAIVDPGRIIGGDPLFDLACVLAPGQPAEFREGFLSGYLATPLAPDEHRRLRRLRLLVSFLTACRRYLLAEPYEQQAALSLSLLAEIQAEATAG